MMRTSTGSMRVMKMLQKQKPRSLKSKNTMAKAARRETTIFPTEMPRAMMRELFIMDQGGGAEVLRALEEGAGVVLEEVRPG